MPKLIESIMVETAKTRFRQYNLTLPTVAKTGLPSNTGQFLAQKGSAAIAGNTAPQLAVNISSTLPPKLTASMAPVARTVAVPQSVPPALIRAASSDKGDIDLQTQVSNEYSSYLAAICHAIVEAHDQWRLAAHLQGVVIMGTSATGGSITGPSLSPIIAGMGPQQGLWGNAAAYTKAIADGLASCWTAWQQSVSVPNLPWYPSFVAVPATMAPPVPNVPTPLSALKWSSALLAPDAIKTAIARKLGQPGPYSDELFQSIAAGFGGATAMWFPGQMITNVLGKGPVPSFAPPYVPVAPVVAGSIVEGASHFAT